MPPDLFLSGDWGTSRLRLRLVRSQPFAVLAEVESDAGIAWTFDAWQQSGGVEGADREAFYLGVLAPEVARLRLAAGTNLEDVPLVLSGMASSTIGLRALPYAPVPFDLAAATLPTAWIAPGVLPCATLLVSGLCSDNDVMRGEETILLGLAALGDGDGLYLLPGTHSKHIDVRRGVLEGFRTYLTGELFALLRDHSVLRSCLAPSDEPGEAFLRGVAEAQSANLLRACFGLRARSILNATPPETSSQQLSGLLIGTELRDLDPHDPRPIHLAAGEPLRSSYAAALRHLGHGDRLRVVPAEEVGAALALGQRALLAGRP